MNEEYNDFDDFLLKIAGFNQKIIKKCELDINNGLKIGKLMLFVGIYAFFAWSSYFMQIGINSILAILGGLIFGSFIVAFDGAIIASMTSGKTSWTSLVFRMIFAVVIGVFFVRTHNSIYI